MQGSGLGALRMQIVWVMSSLCLFGCGDGGSQAQKPHESAKAEQSSPSSRRATASAASASASSASAATSASAAPATPPAVVKQFVPAHEVPAFKGKFPHRAHPLGNTTGRVVELKLARPSKEPDVAPMWTLKNLTDKPVEVGQTWLYYYDAEKKKQDRYPSSLGFTLKLGPGESKEERLGQPAAKLEAGLTVFEGEVTSANVDGARWHNENLIPQPRPAGGVDAQALADSAGERLIVDVYDLTSYRIRVTNITDKPFKRGGLTFHYKDPKGQDVEVACNFPDELKPIEAGASVDITAKAWSAKEAKPPKASDVVAYVHWADFDQGPSFRNSNLKEDVDWKAMGDR